jgi:hypothetical protein
MAARAAGKIDTGDFKQQVFGEETRETRDARSCGEIPGRIDIETQYFIEFFSPSASSQRESRKQFHEPIG